MIFLQPLIVSRWIRLLFLLLLVGCAQQRIRDETTRQLREGNFEAAIQGLQQGVSEYPENASLRAGLASAKGEAVARLVADVAQFRAAGKWNEADATIARGQKLDPGNTRLLSLQGDLLLARKLQQRMDDANALLAEGKKEKALQLVELALKDAPRQPEFLALQRRLELELRFTNSAASSKGLADGRTIALDFRNAPLSLLLEAITKSSGVNFVFDRDVRQDSRVTVFVKNAKVDDALDLVLAASQLARRTLDSNTVLLYPNTVEKQREHQEQVIRVFHLANANAKSTAAFLKAMLRIKDPFVDERANLMSIRETPELVALAERLVALHDIAEAEVMLEVEILEIKTSRLTELGINFPNSLTLTPLPASGQTGLTLGSLRGLNNDRIGVSVAGLLINLRREVGDFNILANPRIRAKSREKAQILIGDKVPVITATSSATGFVAESVNYLDVGLKLEVEPVVSPDDEITIKLALEVSTLAKEVRTSAGTLAYQIGTRNANTILRLRDGETQVLAGLISNEDRTTSNRVPGLGDLPVAGRLFGSQKDDVQRAELVLAITPRLVRSAARPDISQAELWVGTELATRLRASPSQKAAEAVKVPSEPSLPSGSTATTDKATVASTDAVVGPSRVSWLGPAEVLVNDIFDVDLQLASGVPLQGLPLEIGFPVDGLEIVDVQEGDFFKQNGGTTSFTHAKNVTGGKLATVVIRGENSVVSGKGRVVRLKLRALRPGTWNLRLLSAQPLVLNGAVPLLDLPGWAVSAKP